MSGRRREELLAAYRAERGPSELAEDRLWARLERRVHARTPAAAAVSPQSRWRVAAVATVVLAAAAAVVMWWPSGRTIEASAEDESDNLAPHASKAVDRDDRARARSERPPASRVPTEVAAPPAPIPTPEPPMPPSANQAAGRPEPATVPRRKPKRPAPDIAPEPVPADDSLVAEIELIRRARAELGKGRIDSALTILGDYGRQFPQGRLAEEADAVETTARCRANAKDPIALADGFDARHRSSLFSRQVRGACEAAAHRIESK